MIFALERLFGAWGDPHKAAMGSFGLIDGFFCIAKQLMRFIAGIKLYELLGYNTSNTVPKHGSISKHLQAAMRGSEFGEVLSALDTIGTEVVHWSKKLPS